MLYESLDLTKFIGVEIEEREVNGRIQSCISIPIKLNGLVLSRKNRVYLNLCLIDKHMNERNETHFVSVRFSDKNALENVTRLGYDKDLRYIGIVSLNKYMRHEDE